MFANSYNQAVKQVAQYATENLSSEAQRLLHFAKRHKQAPVYFDDDGVPCALHEPKAQVFDYNAAIATLASEMQSLESAFSNLYYDASAGAIIEDCEKVKGYFYDTNGHLQALEHTPRTQKRLKLRDIYQAAFGALASDILRLVSSKKPREGTF